MIFSILNFIDSSFLKIIISEKFSTTNYQGFIIYDVYSNKSANGYSLEYQFYEKINFILYSLYKIILFMLNDFYDTYKFYWIDSAKDFLIIFQFPFFLTIKNIYLFYISCIKFFLLNIFIGFYYIIFILFNFLNTVIIYLISYFNLKCNILAFFEQGNRIFFTKFWYRYFLETAFSFLWLLICILLSVAFYTLAERKLIASVQRRQGPSVVGKFGLLQAIADGLKLFVKEPIFPHISDLFIFFIAPILTFLLSIAIWGIVPFSNYEFSIIVNLNLGILYIFAISSLGVYGIIMAGWSSNSKYAFLGGLRSTAQMVSYEVSIGLTLLTVILCAGSFNLKTIIFSQELLWYSIALYPSFLIFIISSLAETNRHPFDLPEAEAELVAGYNVEYASMPFALFFLGEYSNMLFMAVIISILFLGGWFIPFIGYNEYIDFYNSFGSYIFSLKVVFFVFFFIIARAILPRYRYDQLMYLGWKVFLPFTIAFFIFVASFLFTFDLMAFSSNVKY